MVSEAVNDHLRVLYAEPRVEIASGGIHQVKPWFAGRLDFAPVMPFAGDDDFPLEGGSVAYFLDRKAAAFVFKRRLHVVTVFVFRADGLAWPAPTEAIGRVRATASSSRGFHALLFRDGDLGYAVVSDVDAQDVRALALRIVGP
jgi:anti-sigma factor RsiW